MKLKICLPLVIALVVVLGTVGIVLGAAVISRTVNLPVLDPITVDLENGSYLQPVYRGYSIELPINVTNTSTVSTEVDVTWGNLPTGITITFKDGTPNHLSLPPASGGKFTLVIDASQSASNCQLTFDFPYYPTP